LSQYFLLPFGFGLPAFRIEAAIAWLRGWPARCISAIFWEMIFWDLPGLSGMTRVLVLILGSEVF
jgi:hypothetical protein